MPDESREAAPSPALHLGPYELDREIGRGAMGVVYLAVHAGLKRTCALKVIQPGENAPSAERFRREAQSCARIGKHPNIVQVFDVGEAEGKVYFAMELVDGRDLARIVAERGPLPELEAFEITRKIAIALDHAHRRGIVHRDIKPSNVIVDSAGEPQLTDFGLALDVEAAHLTREGEILGTPQYMAPEQAQSKAALVGPRTDVYALGATLFDLLTGRAPFDGTSVVSVVASVILDDPPRLRSLRADCSAVAEAIVAKAMEKDPARRYATALEMADDLSRAIAGEATRVRPFGWRDEARRLVRRNRAAVATAAVGLLLALLLGGGLGVRALRARARREAAARRSLEALAADTIAEQVQRLEEAVALDPSLAATHVQLAEAHYSRAVERYRRGEWEGYEADLRAAIAAAEEAERRGAAVSAPHLAGNLYEWLGDTPHAIAAFRRAGARKEDGWWGASGLANAAILEAKWAEAVEWATKTIAASAEDPMPYEKRSIARLAQGDLDGALADADAAVRLLSTDDWVVAQRARVRLARGELRLAAEDAIEALRHYPQSPAAYEVLAALARREGAAQRAAGLAARAASLARGRLPAYFYCRDQPWAQLAEAPGPAAAHVGEAEARLARGDAAGALAEASVALGLDPADGDALAARARAFEGLGRGADAADDRKWATLLGAGERP